MKDPDNIHKLRSDLQASQRLVQAYETYAKLYRGVAIDANAHLRKALRAAAAWRFLAALQAVVIAAYIASRIL